MEEREPDIDYAIIGGGVAGTYCAWRLQQVHPEKKIVLFENSDRIGGRLLTIRLPGEDKMKVELGGMRFMPEQKVEGTEELMGHPIFSWLVKEFKLETEDFPMGYPDDEEWGENNYVYFRGQHLRVKDLKDPEKSKVFNLEWSERGKSPNMLQEHVQRILVPGAEGLDLNDWFKVKVFGEPLWKYGFWNLLYRVLSPEAYTLLKIGSGYDTNASNGNAVALLPILKDYLASTQYRTLKSGMMTLPQTLADKFKSLDGKIESKKRIQKNHRLDSIEDRDKDAFYRLTFAITNTDDRRKEATTDTTEPDEYWRARNVILAIPTAALRKVKCNLLQANKDVKRMIDSAIPQEAIKLVLEYPYAWWKALGLFRGRSITDLPLRQTFYFSDLEDLRQENPFEIKPKKPSLLMASYSDIESVPFWRGLEGTDLYRRPADVYKGHNNGYRASKIMVQEAHRQVMKIHGQSELPMPTRAAYFDWADSPYGAAWHAWEPGCEFNKIIDAIRRPVKTENIFICGEAYSALQGWAEGALNTAEQMLTTDIDEKLPALLEPKGRTARAMRKSILRVDAKGRRY